MNDIIATRTNNLNAPEMFDHLRSVIEAQWMYFDMNILTQKKCTKCGETKPLAEFGKRKDSPCGYRAWCKKCVNIWHHDYQKEHPEKSRVISLRWRNNHLETARANWHKFIASLPAGWDAERKRKRYAENREEELKQARVRNSK